jgi:predicted TPR repeat methyltransferase
MLEHQRGNPGRGIELLQRSVRSAPGNPHAWVNLGNMLMNAGQLERADEAFQRATALATGLWEPWFNRGILLRRLKRYEEAIASLKTSLELNPRHDLGYDRLGMLLYASGRLEELAELYRAWITHNPDSVTARHMHAALSGETPPDRASDEYVRETFDAFADSFDQNLADLGYRAPQLIADAVRRHRATDGAASLDVLDAGVGTGLSGPLLRGFARTLTGVDLSPAMVDKARERRLYDELAVDELCAYMLGRVDAFDIVISADTLVYFGALEGALAAAHACLRRGGLLAFTVELWQTDDEAARFRMGAHGRYMHALRYVRAVLETAGFRVDDVEQVVLRTELGKDVQGLLAVATRREGDASEARAIPAPSGPPRMQP